MTSLEERPLSAGDSGYQRIRADIIFGVLTPSGRLKLDAMKEDYGLSISTLREILNRLTSEGFVVAEGQRGFEVAPIPSRTCVSSPACASCWSIMRWPSRSAPATSSGKAASCPRITSWRRPNAPSLSEGDDPELRKRYDGEFHQALISSCGSRELMQTHAVVFDKYFRYALRYRGAETINQHKALLECALKRDIKSARAVLTEHINGCVAHALASWNED